MPIQYADNRFETTCQESTRPDGYSGDRSEVTEDALMLPSQGAGRRRTPVRYRLEGPPGAPLVVVLGGINAGRDPRAWWPEQTGEGRPLDPTRWRLLGIDWTVPSDCSAPDTGDQAAAVEAVLARHHLGRVAAFVGASYGAMVGLALAVRRRVPVDALLAISAAHESHPAATAARYLQREIVRLGLATGQPSQGLRLARGLAMTTYRTRALFAERFDEPQPADRIASVASYLAHVGERFAEHFGGRCFLALSESLDRHAIVPEQVSCPVTLVAVHSDQLVPVEQIEVLAGRLPGPCRLERVESAYGHDAFLTEHRAFRRILSDFLAEQPVKESTHVSAGE